MLAAYDALSEESIYLRFMRAKRTPPPEQVAQFLDYNPDHQISLLLTDLAGQPLAQAQSIRRRLHPDRAEFACIVADHFQHKGAGRRILLSLALLARADGILDWTAEVLAQNRPMLTLFKAAGPATDPGHGSRDGICQARFVGAGSLAASAASRDRFKTKGE